MLLATPRLSLIPFSPADTDALRQLWTEPQGRKFLWDDQVIPRSMVAEIVEDSVRSFNERGFGFWTLHLKEDPMLIGFCGLRQLSLPPGGTTEVEILYGLRPEYWGRGLATEASAEVLRYGFEEANLKRIYAGADPTNRASFRVMERLGMQFAQRVVTNGLVGEGVADYYFITRAEFKP